MEVSTRYIVKNTVSSIKIPEKKDIKDWFKQFKELNKTRQNQIIAELNKSQSIYIRDYMGKMENPIPLYILGKFYFKRSRKEFYEIRKQNPNMPLEEVIAIVKQKYWDRYIKRKKLRKNKDIRIKL